MSSVHELQGELVSVIWRNPHIEFIVNVVNDEGEEELWTIEGWGSLYTLQRTGVEEQDFRIGDTVQFVGHVSTRQPRNVLGTNVLLANGTEVVLRADIAPYWTDEHIGGGDRWSADESQLAESIAGEDRGIFRVWSPSGYGALNTTKRHFPFSESAIAARASWDIEDNFVMRCEDGGMPSGMMMPHPYEFIDEGSEITLKGEVWDMVRTAHMDSLGNAAPSPLGHSTGRWDGNTLIVETNAINWPYFDGAGTPQSEAVTITERFTVSGDQARLDYHMTISDPETFTEPATYETYWLALGETVELFDCQVPGK